MFASVAWPFLNGLELSRGSVTFKFDDHISPRHQACET